MGFSLSIVFIFALVMVGISLLSVLFPALILANFGSITTSAYNAFEIGNNASLVIIGNIVLFSIGLIYKKNKIPNFSSFVNKIRDFDISKKYSIIIGIIILIAYVIIVSPELSIDENTQWADYQILVSALETFPKTDSGDQIEDEQNSRFVRMLLLSFSQDYLNNIKILPLVSSIVLIIMVGLISTEISQTRIAGIIGMLVLIQGYTFLEYDTIAVYENFWVTFFLISIYMIHKKWQFSGIFYLLSVFSKAFSTPFLILNAYYVLRSKLDSKTVQSMIPKYLSHNNEIITVIHPRHINKSHTNTTLLSLDHSIKKIKLGNGVTLLLKHDPILPKTFAQIMTWGGIRSETKNTNGIGMLLYQGCESFTFWTGKDAPEEVMRNRLLGLID